MNTLDCPDCYVPLKVKRVEGTKGVRVTECPECLSIYRVNTDGVIVHALSAKSTLEQSKTQETD